jgi:ABC-type transport system involved in multi-copper enzyme maturation permease subunit
VNGLIALWGRLDLLQRRSWLRVLATVVVVAASAGFFGSVVSIRHEWDQAARSLGQSLTSDEAAVYGTLLRESGTVVVEGQEYAGPVEVLQTLIDEDGTPTDVQRIVFVLLRDWIPGWAPRWLLLETEIAWAMMFLCMAIGVGVIWSGLMVQVGVLLVGGSGVSWAFWLLAWDRWVGVPIAMAFLLSTFLMAIRGLQMMLAGRHGWMAVAHTLLREVSRTRLAMGFVVILLLVLPLLPLTLDESAPIGHIVQAYLARSLGFAFSIAALLVLLVGCSSICFDIRDRHIWHLVTKPLGRASYLFGKWIGVVLLGGVMLAIAGGWSFGWVQYTRNSYMPRTRVEFAEQAALMEDVLVARRSMPPVYEELDESAIRSRVDQILLEDPEYQEFADGEAPLGLHRLLRKRVRDEFDQQRRLVETVLDRSGRPWETLHFEGLTEAKQLGLPIRLKFRLVGGASDEHDRRAVGFAVGEDRSSGAVGAFIPTVFQTIDLPVTAITDDGTLDVSIVNLTHVPPPSGTDWRWPLDLEAMALGAGTKEPFAIFWQPDELELEYPAGTFGANFARGMGMLFLKLMILAAVACAVSTFLSFPVACLVVFSLYAAASIAPWLATTLNAYGGGPMQGEGVGAVIQSVIEDSVRTVASIMVYALRAFGEIQPVDRLVQGRLISWERIGSGIVLVLSWGGGGLLVGWFILSKRQLSLYSGDQ